MDGNSPLFSGSVADGYREYLEPVMFRPWAELLVDFVGLSVGQTALDVAAGTGVVSRAAALRVGAGGRVIAADLSAAMLEHVSQGFPHEGPPLETKTCPATALELPDACVDVVFCQQGLQFFPDKAMATSEMYRVLRPGGRVGLAVWLSSPRVHPFIDYGDALRTNAVPEPFPGAYDSTFLSMTVDDVQRVLDGAGFEDSVLRIEKLELTWPTVRNAVRGVFGTPFGPLVSALDDDTRASVLSDVEKHMTGEDGAPTKHVMTSILARARRP